MQSINDNVRLLDEETIKKVKEVVVRDSYKLVKKKTKDSGCNRGCNRRGAFGWEGLAQAQILEARTEVSDEEQHEGVIWRGKK